MNKNLVSLVLWVAGALAAYKITMALDYSFDKVSQVEVSDGYFD